MSVLSAEEVAGHCHRAGFSAESLVTVVAIAKGESGFNAAAVGDVGLADGTWGPSVGLLQVRSLRVEKGTGGIRDEIANLDPAHNAQAGWEISGHGRSFTPWSVYTSGTYKQFLDTVRPACLSVDGRVLPPRGGRRRTPNDEPVLHIGSVGEAVGRVQELLDQVGFQQPGDLFRVFGPATYDAVVAYQESRDLDIDGVVGRETWGALKSGAPPV